MYTDYIYMDISTEKWMERLIYGEIDSSIAFDRLMVFGGILWEYNRKRCLPCRQKNRKGCPVDLPGQVWNL